MAEIAPPPQPQRRSIIGLQVAATNYREVVEWVVARARARDAVYAVEAANTHVAALARYDKDFGEVMSRFDLVCPDGMPLVWSLNRLLPPEHKLSDRVYGPTLMLETLRGTAHDPELKHFLLGGKQSTLDRLATRFADQFPGTLFVGSYSPPFGDWSEEEHADIIRRIKESGATIIWVGLGCPKQERWIIGNKHLLPHGVYFGIGAAFAFHAGEVRQAPPLLQRFGMEWAYRLLMEPRRLFRRYFTYNFLFLYYLLRDAISGGKSAITPERSG